MNKKTNSLIDTDFNQHGGDLATARVQFGRKRFLDLSININRWGPPLKLWLSLVINLPKIKEYPQPYSTKGREALAGFFGIEPDYVAMGNGAAELIHCLPRVLPVKRGIIFTPTFTEYERALVIAGRQIIKIPLTPDYQLPLTQLKTTLAPGDLIFICQPNNPTGRLFTEQDIMVILELAASRGSWVVIDESFLWFAGQIRKLSLCHCLDRFSNLVIINSLTKVVSIPGLRLGFVIAQPETIGLISNSLNQWNVNHLVQQLIPRMLDPNFFNTSLRSLKKENCWLKHRLAKVPGLIIQPWDANFYLVKVDIPMLNAGEIIQEFGKLGILVRDCSNFDGLSSEYFRVAVGNHSQNKKFLKKLFRILNRKRVLHT